MILFISYGGGHIKTISRLYKYFVLQNENSTLLPLTSAIPFCLENGINNFLSLDELYEKYVNEKYSSYIEEVVANTHEEWTKIPYSHTHTYLHISLTELFNKNGYDNGIELFERFGRRIFFPIKFAQKVLKTIKPKAVITTNSPRMELAFQVAANRMKIKSFSIDDLVGIPFERIASSITFVENDIAKENLIKSGYEGKTYVTGNPAFDELQGLKKNTNNSLVILHQTGVRNLTNNAIEKLHKDFYIKFFDKLKSMSFFDNFDKILIRYHPSVSPNEKYDYGFVVDHRENVIDSIRNCKFALSFSSTSLYEFYKAGCIVYPFTFGEDYFNLPINYFGKVNMDAEIDIINNQPIKILKYKVNNASQAILEKVRNEIYHN